MPTFSYSHACAPNIWLRALGVHIGKIWLISYQPMLAQCFPEPKKPNISSIHTMVRIIKLCPYFLSHHCVAYPSRVR